MTEKYNKKSEVAARAMMECREVNVFRESQIAQAEREILAAQGGVARAEAVACRAQNHEELAVRQFLVEQDAQRVATNAFHLRGQEMHEFRSEALSLFETCVSERTGWESEQEMFVNMTAEALAQRNND